MFFKFTEILWKEHIFKLIIKRGKGRFADPVYTLKQLITKSNIEKTSSSRWMFLYTSLVDCHEGSGDIYSALDDLDAAIRTLSLLTNARDKIAELYLQKASLHCKNGNAQEAVGAYAQALQRDPQTVSATFERKVMALGTLGMPVGTPSDTTRDASDDNFTLFVEAITQDLRGRRDFKNGENEAAQRHFKAAIDSYTQLEHHDRVDPDIKVFLRDRRGQLLLSVKTTTREAVEADTEALHAARDVFSHLIKIDPKRADFYLHRGHAHMELAFYDDALKDMIEAIHLAPSWDRINRIAHEKSAEIYLMRQDPEATETAITHLQEALANHPDAAPQLKLQLALALYLQKEYWQCFVQLAAVSAALETLDAIDRERLQMRIKLLMKKLPFLTLEEPTPKKKEEVKHRFRTALEDAEDFKGADRKDCKSAIAVIQEHCARLNEAA